MTNSGTTRRTLRLGAVPDQTSPDWSAFYPEGLPEDWRVAYLGQFWRECLLPAEVWAGAAEGPDWADELPDHLRLFLDAAAATARDLSRMSALADKVGERLAGVLTRASEAAFLPVAPGLVFKAVDAPAIRHASRVERFIGREGAILVIEPAPGLNLPRWRDLLESAAQAHTDRRLPVFLRAGPKELETAETILRLLGPG